MKSRFILLAALACAVLIAPAPSQAASPDRPGRFAQAQEAIAAQDWEGARRVLQALWADERTYDVALSLGQVELHLKQYADAANHLAFGLRHLPPREGEDLERRAKELLDFAKQFVASANITVTQPNAEIRVDSTRIGHSPLESEWFVEPGVHVIQARLPGGASAEQTIDLRSGSTHSVQLDPRPEIASAAPRSRPMSATADSVPPEVEPSGHPYPLYFGGAAIAGVGAGVGFLIGASAKESEKEDVLERIPGTNRCGTGTEYGTECERARSLTQGAQTFRSVGYLSLGLGAAAGAAALVLLAMPDDDRRVGQTGTWTLLPSIVPGSTGATLTGAFE